MFTLTKSLTQDFPRGLTHHHLKREIINAGVASCSDVYQTGDAVTINFTSDPTPNLTTINNVITDYIPVPSFFDDLKFVSVGESDSPYSVTTKSVKCDTGDITVLLPKSQRVRNGIFAIQKTAAGGTVTIVPNGSETINGLGNLQISTLGSYYVLKNDGSNWTTTTSDRVDTSANDALTVASTKGDMLVDDGTEMSSLHVGSDGNVLIADSTQPLGVRWGGITAGLPVCTEISVVTTTTTTSTAYILINGMTVTPSAGTYLVMFSATGSVSTASAQIYYGVYVGGTLVASSERLFRAATSTVHTLYTQAKVNVNGSQAIEIRFKTSTGTFTINSRNMCIVSVL